MSVNLNDMSRAKAVVGLNTYNYTVLSTGMHKVNVRASIQPGSAISILIKLNGSTLFTSEVPAAQATHIELADKLIACSANDVIGIVASSSNAIDSQHPLPKMVIRIDRQD